MSASGAVRGPRAELGLHDRGYPDALRALALPPERLYVLGDVGALGPGLAVIGARKATPYGRGCARRFARLAAEKGVTVISGGARGCDAEAHRAALEVGGVTVVFLGGGCDELYPAEHFGLFQEVVDAGGALVSEHPWTFPPRPYAFRARNRLIAGLADAVLIVEAGLPSGTFSTADEALEAGKEVLVVPGSIASPESRGSNLLLAQGATPIVDDDTFSDALFRACNALRRPGGEGAATAAAEDPLVAAMLAEPLTAEGLLDMASRLYGAAGRAKMMESLAEAEARGIVAKRPDGKWGPAVTIRR